jgi:hypothetical protein
MPLLIVLSFFPAATKLVCSLGPSSHSVGVLEAMLRAGMVAARIDLTWGGLDFHRATLAALNVSGWRIHRAAAACCWLLHPRTELHEAPVWRRRDVHVCSLLWCFKEQFVLAGSMGVFCNCCAPAYCWGCCSPCIFRLFILLP